MVKLAVPEDAESDTDDTGTGSSRFQVPDTAAKLSIVLRSEPAFPRLAHAHG
jgi:hypothetical protein